MEWADKWQMEYNVNNLYERKVILGSRDAKLQKYSQGGWRRQRSKS